MTTTNEEFALPPEEVQYRNISHWIHTHDDGEICESFGNPTLLSHFMSKLREQEEYRTVTNLGLMVARALANERTTMLKALFPDIVGVKELQPVNQHSTQVMYFVKLARKRHDFLQLLIRHYQDEFVSGETTDEESDFE